MRQTGQKRGFFGPVLERGEKKDQGQKSEHHLFI